MKVILYGAQKGHGIRVGDNPENATLMELYRQHHVDGIGSLNDINTGSIEDISRRLDQLASFGLEAEVNCDVKSGQWNRLNPNNPLNVATANDQQSLQLLQYKLPLIADKISACYLGHEFMEKAHRDDGRFAVDTVKAIDPNVKTRIYYANLRIGWERLTRTKDNDPNYYFDRVAKGTKDVLPSYVHVEAPKPIDSGGASPIHDYIGLLLAEVQPFLLHCVDVELYVHFNVKIDVTTGGIQIPGVNSQTKAINSVALALRMIRKINPAYCSVRTLNMNTNDTVQPSANVLSAIKQYKELWN